MAEYDAYLHIEFTNDPDNYVKNDGSSLPIELTFREGISTDSAVLTAITGVDVIITFCNIYGRTYDIYKVSFTSGAATFNFTASTMHSPEVVYINDRTMEPIYIGDDVYNTKNNVVNRYTKRFIVVADGSSSARQNLLDPVLCTTTTELEGVGGTDWTFATGTHTFTYNTTNTDPTTDGVTLDTLGQRVLVKDESTHDAYNGIFYVTQVADVGVACVLTRATDYDTAEEISDSDFVFVQQGTIYADSGWIQTEDVTTLETSTINWTQFVSSITLGVDNRLARYHNTNSIQDTGITVADDDQITGVAGITIDNIDIDGNTISTTDTDGDLTLSPDGTGSVVIDTDLILSTGTSVNEFSIDGNLADNSDDAVPTEKAVKTYVDAHADGTGADHTYINQDVTSTASPAFTGGITIGAASTIQLKNEVGSVTTDPYSLGFNTTSRRITFSSEQGSLRQALQFGDAGAGTDTYFGVAASSDSGSTWDTGIKVLQNGSVSLRLGTSINEFSIDGTLAGNSDDAVPTEQAVKTYRDIDNHDDITSTSEGVAASVSTHTTFVTTDGDSDLNNVTLADGTEGQTKTICCVVEGNAADTWKITPANMVGGNQITFNGVGEGCILKMYSAGWVVVGNNGGTIS